MTQVEHARLKRQWNYNAISLGVNAKQNAFGANSVRHYLPPLKTSNHVAAQDITVLFQANLFESYLEMVE